LSFSWKLKTPSHDFENCYKIKTARLAGLGLARRFFAGCYSDSGFYRVFISSVQFPAPPCPVFSFVLDK
jgi:hypothetical protein